MLFLLYHSFPKVRKLTAEKLYTALLTMEDYSQVIPKGEDDYDAAVEMLSETNWTDLLKELSPTKERMYGFFEMTPPPKATPSTNSQSNTTKAATPMDGVEQIKT
jgi:hypothetical protein